MNILGVLTFSALFGWALSSLGEWRGVVGSSAPPPCSVQPAPVVSAHSPAPPHPTNKPHTCPGPAADGVVKGVGVLNAAVGRMVGAALWVSPLGIASLIAASILRACDLAGARAPRAQTLALVCLPCFVGHRPPPPASAPISPPPPPFHPPHTPPGTLAALGLWVGTVTLGLALFASCILPALLATLTRRSPIAVARCYGQALLMAFGTSSSAAALPLAMQVGGRVLGAVSVVCVVEGRAGVWLGGWVGGVLGGEALTISSVLLPLPRPPPPLTHPAHPPAHLPVWWCRAPGTRGVRTPPSTFSSPSLPPSTSTALHFTRQ